MKAILNFFALIIPIILAEGLPTTQQMHLHTFDQKNNPNDRKLTFTPYTEFNNGFTANSPRFNAQTNNINNNTAYNQLQNTSQPSFGYSNMPQPNLGLAQPSFNYMQNSPFGNSINSKYSANPTNLTTQYKANETPGLFGQDPFTSKYTSNFPKMDNNSYLKNHRNLSVKNKMPLKKKKSRGLNDFDEFSDNFNFDNDFGFSKKFDNLQAFKDENDGVITQCKDVQKQAIQISNSIMRRQNKVIFKTLMNYLLKSKYLLTMTEIKLARVLRKKIFALMNKYSSITDHNIEFIPMREDYNLEPKESEEGSEEGNNFTGREIKNDNNDLFSNAPGFEGVLSRK